MGNYKTVDIVEIEKAWGSPISNLVLKDVLDTGVLFEYAEHYASVNSLVFFQILTIERNIYFVFKFTL
jgi:hypothetical protein